MDRSSVSASVVIGEESTVVIRRSTRSAPIVAKALDIVMDEEGRPKRILLDRRVHRRDEHWGSPWSATGAMVTLLEREE